MKSLEIAFLVNKILKAVLYTIIVVDILVFLYFIISRLP